MAWTRWRHSGVVVWPELRLQMDLSLLVRFHAWGDYWIIGVSVRFVSVVGLITPVSAFGFLLRCHANSARTWACVASNVGGGHVKKLK